MSKRDWKLFIIEILESIEKIKQYISGLGYDEFVKDTKTRDAVVRNLEIIGEAANAIPKDIQNKYSEIPWAQVIGMRNRLIHGYFVIDYKIVWQIIIEELPVLKSGIEKILKEG